MAEILEIHFTNLQENGDDFIVIDEWEPVIIPENMKGQFAAIHCDRRVDPGLIIPDPDSFLIQN